MLNRPLQLAVLISGGGTTLINFLGAIAAGRMKAEIALVIASRKCDGITKAEQAGIQCTVIPRKEFSDVVTFSEEIFRNCRNANIDLVTLAGFLSLLQISNDFLGRVMNIHPSLIPAFCGHGFYGQFVHESVINRGVKVSGCTVHFVDNEYDHGPIITQKCVPILPGDTKDLLAARIFEAECEAYPEAIELFRQNRLQIKGLIVNVLPFSNLE